ncbi:MAG: purine-nucleoside phosphorylase [Clostridium sp.]|nr:purine-nucleoside phosphorylase [Clostridium sp.]
MKLDKIKEAAQFVKEKISIEPHIGVILGSGLGDLADMVENPVIIDYKDVPYLPASTVKGHKGRFVIGKLSGKNIIIMQGRLHYYEGNSMESIALPIYIMKHLNVKSLIVTNAAGGINKDFLPGDLMIIKDHINFAFNNPLIGPNDENIGPRFPDMSRAYNRDLINIAYEVGKDTKIKLQSGTYIMMTGPNYETPAEIKMARILGADAVGMSTVPEVIAANHCKINVLGISCITNMAAGILDKPLSHSEVVETSNMVKDNFQKLLLNIIERM